MRLLLLFMFSMIVVGLLTERLDRRTYLVVGTAASTVTALYFTIVRLM